jgi:hypothetical protein
MENEMSPFKNKLSLSYGPYRRAFIDGKLEILDPWI